MNVAHFSAFLWLRYRLLANQIAKGGIANKIILALLAVGGGVSFVVITIASFFVGWLALDAITPLVMMFIWDGIVIAFFFTWCIGVLSELQRSEALSIEKFLHLPVSVAGVFGLNYLSSLFSINLILFAPAMFGFCAGLTLSRGPAVLLIFPLIVAHLLMVTALTYQFQGWLASLMIDQRRRRTVIVLVTFVFVMICQLPNLVNVFRPWEKAKDGVNERSAAQQIENRRARDAGEITMEEFQARHIKIIAEQKSGAASSNQQVMATVDGYAYLFNTILPIGWLPLGVRGAVEGNVLPALFGTLAYSLIGAASLWRAYRTTLRIYTGQFTKGSAPAIAPSTPSKASEAPRETLIDRNLPWFSEQTSVIALAGFRSLTRAPEAKMLLIAPVMMLVVVGGMYFRIPGEMPVYVRPFVAFGGMSFILVALTQWVGNQFGFDRAGFRVFVLSPAPRRDILLGKNLAAAPIALTLCAITTCMVQLLFPMRIDHFLAMFPQMASMYLLFCTFANFLSIYAPMAIAPGTTKPASTKLVPVLLSLLFMGAFSVVMGMTMLPFGIEAGLDALEWVQGIPIYLPASLLICAGTALVYRSALVWQGRLLQAHEQAILEIVTTKTE